jgi:hypothetical protein
MCGQTLLWEDGEEEVYKGEKGWEIGKNSIPKTGWQGEVMFGAGRRGASVVLGSII